MNTAPPHILLVNPWIHDFAAYDVWASPLGLLGLAAILREHGFKVTYYDCLNRFHPRSRMPDRAARFGRGPYPKSELPKPAGLEDIPRRYCRYGVNPEWFYEDLVAMPRPDLILVTSIMTYWYPGVVETIRLIRRRWPEATVILGGIYATLCREHAEAHSGADIVVSGFTGPDVVSIVSRLTRHPATPRFAVDDLDAYPMPALELLSRIPHAPVLTSVGCPFSCAYCAASLLSPGRWRKTPEQIAAEVLHWNRAFGVVDFAFYDDALLADAEQHALPLLERLARLPADVRFHTPNALHIRNITPRLARLMVQTGFRTVRLGLETADTRDFDHKTSREEFEAAARILRDAGFSSSELGAYLLVGLPGQSMDTVRTSIRTVKAAGVRPIPAYYTPIPHTPLWEAAVHASRYDLEADPVFTNNTIFPCIGDGFSWDLIQRVRSWVAE